MENYYPSVELQKSGDDYRLVPIDEASLAMICFLSNSENDYIDLRKIDPEDLAETVSDYLPPNLKKWADNPDFVSSLVDLSFETGESYWSKPNLYWLEIDMIRYANESTSLEFGDHDDLIMQYNISLGLTSPPYLIWELPYDDEDAPTEIWSFNDYVYRGPINNICKNGYALFEYIDLEEED